MCVTDCLSFGVQLPQIEAQSKKQQEQLERLRKDMGAVPMETCTQTGWCESLSLCSVEAQIVNNVA